MFSLLTLLLTCQTTNCMSTFSRRNFLKSAGILGGGFTAFGSTIPERLFAGTSAFGLPYYKPGAPFLDDLRKSMDAALTLQGVVYQHDGKTPLADAVVEIWHCNGQGHFDFSKHYAYRGKTLTDKQGRYRIKTNFPGQYREKGHLKMSRIFILVNGAGHQESFSQLYLDHSRKPYIDSRHWAASPLAQRPSLPKRLQSKNQQVITYDHFLNPLGFGHIPDARETANSRLSVFPGRLSAQPCLTFGKSRPGNVMVRLLDTKRQVVQKQFFKDVKPETILVMGDQSLPAGVYTCSISSSHFGAFVRRFSVG
jgi:protocatechuate 3,4-dioxygenase beta subunit